MEGQNKWRENHGLRNFGAQSLHAFIEDLTSCVNFFLPSEEKEDVVVGFREVDLHDSDEGSVKVIVFWSSGKIPSYVVLPMNYLGYIALGFTCVALHSLGSSGSNSRTLCRPGSFR